MKLFQKVSVEGTFPSSFYKTSISPTPSNRQNMREKENHSPIIPMNIDPEILNKILVNWIKWDIKKIIHYDQLEYIPGIQGYFNICKLVNVFHHTNKWKGKKMNISTDAEKAFEKIQHPLVIRNSPESEHRKPVST